jgi:beta-lactamase class A
MSLSRRSLLATAGAALPAVAFAPACAAQSAPQPQEPDLSTPDGWLAWMGTHRDQFSLVLDDGRGQRLVHRPDVVRPLASAVKVIHLAAYATAIAEGVLDPQEPVRVGDWERFYVPTDGGAHVAALHKLGIPTDPTGLYAADPDHVVPVDQMVAAMIEFSDSAVPDYLRNRLGDASLGRAAHAAGWPDPDVRSMCAEYVFLALPEYAPPAGTPVPLRRTIGHELERRYSTDPALRRRTLDRLLSQPLPPYETQSAWASGTAGATAPRLAGIHHAIASGTNLARRAADIARNHLERPLRGKLRPGQAGIGFKGGSLPGVVTGGMTVRRTDDSVAWGSLLVHGGVTAEQLAKGDPGLALLLGLDDPAWRARLAQALRP